ncbi:hypothetical protein N5J23_17320 [Comamonas aquatica]|uniref:Uncharacterized protein n=1 Tax=Comamonas aquatica TaxID=225991 RepID=A0AA43AZ51_9BURK|nr:hypothetical protein [Comamonas aquatica]MDH1428281.1 hypothetical protein [Comamonas aquatica]MDH1607549.1 hypothetical protein [Comamonas aquatica]MDH1619287.1 hypothetical protein [Comamonas aquatica]MDH2007269.1 hypothetical protein [Comamonas aquatica]
MKTNIPKDDIEVHKNALKSIEHYYKYSDQRVIVRAVLSVPKTNRREALLKWINEYTGLQWKRDLEKFSTEKALKEFDYETADKNPFWNFKIKRNQKKHVSGNFFDSSSFFDNLIFEIEKNITKISASDIDLFEAKIRKIIAENKKA